MVEIYEVQCKVISQKGTCEQGHKVGDEWIIRRHTPEGICLAAFNCLYPNVRVLMFGGSLPWESERGLDPDVARDACPDPENPVVFELRRLRE